ncbi:MAG: hypothetical protein J7L14_02760 [Candidatus Diapherotrites archaeon]|nr:hypothetical protein [Candidatus Diapherotrites archaeon]
MLDPKLCVVCKGKLLCGLSYCPILAKYNYQINKMKLYKAEKEMQADAPPGIFVSWKNYPNISIAPLSTNIEDEEKLRILDMPERWFGFGEREIIEMRASLIQPMKKIAADASRPSYELIEMQELAMSYKPVDVELRFKKEPKAKLQFNPFVAPFGATAELEKIKLSENPKIPRKVENIYYDELKARDALIELFNKGFPVSYLTRLLSSGVFGRKRKRKIVPTRWSITATDSNLSNAIIEEVKEFEWLNQILVFNESYLDNRFVVLLIPNAFGFEQLECWLPGAVWQQSNKYEIIVDYEFHKGRKDYASNVEGAYYAARLACAEYLKRIRRQAACIVFREIGQNYHLPLGVWVIRETVRNALKKKPESFNNIREALSYAKKFLEVPVEEYLRKSVLLSSLLKQKKLSEFF